MVSRTRLARNLNAGDRVALVLRNPYSSADLDVDIAVTLNFAVAY